MTMKFTFMVSSKKEKKKKTVCAYNFLKTLKKINKYFFLLKICTYIFLGCLLNIIEFKELLWYKTN